MGGGERREGRGGGEYEYSVALQRRVRSDSTHLGRKPGAQGWLEALGSGIFFIFLLPNDSFFLCPNSRGGFLSLHGGLQGYPTQSILAFALR